MDYELKYVIAIFLIVKIAALSPEFSINEETEKPEQSPGKTFSRVPEIRGRLAELQQKGTVDNWGPGRGQFQMTRYFQEERNNVAQSRRQIKENVNFDTCEHKLELLESSSNWRDIRKTLRWLERVLASNQTNICHKRKDKRYFQQSSKLKNVLKKKKSKDLDEHGTRNHFESHSQNKKLRKERKHKHISRKNRFGEESIPIQKLKSERKESRLGKKHSEKIKLFQKNSPTNNTTILKPNSVLFDVEKIFLKRTKSQSGNCRNRQRWSSAGKCVAENGQRENPTERWKIQTQSKEVEKNGTKSPKTKPWPHFVYHRVSSNFLHPKSTNRNHKQSAYVAISVVNSSKIGST